MHRVFFFIILRPNNSGVAQTSNSHKGLRSTVIGIIVSTLLALIKGIGGILGNSYALIADAIESTTDILTSTMLWLGLKWSSRPADHDHPYGHGKMEALVALGVSVAMALAAVVIAVKSIENMITPHKTPEPYTLIILIVVIVTKELLYRFVLKTGAEIKSDAVKADAFHHRSDAITSAAAFIGISIGIIGGEGWEVADDWAALFASAVIMVNAYRILRPAVGELLDEELDPTVNKEVIRLAGSVPQVILVEKCHIRKMGVFKHADLHIWVDKDLTVEEGHAISHRVKDHIQLTLPEFTDVMIHIEPAGHYH
ncbi:cation diffusion facilitator family transporter [Fulvivirgaceae bacterium PWU37]|uniref:Cation diffusion facilitator family transporter n=1 Tax=Dawidia soli TaxID=2782352 RepID=A0AAP2D5S1_9BACT|nr:cation diffusion facilitator family transporter [Dawidia soli]